MAAPPVTGENAEETAPEAVGVPMIVRVADIYVRLIYRLTYRKDGVAHRKWQDYLSSVLSPFTKVHANSELVDGISSKDIVIETANDVWVRIFTPSAEKETSEGKTEDGDSSNNSNKKLPVIIFYHGSGFVMFSADVTMYDDFCRQMAKSCNAVIVSVNYRLAPEFPYPAAYDDCYKAFDWLRSPDSHKELPSTADISQCFLLGDSAGGNIVHQMGRRAAENDISPIKLRGMVLVQPFFGAEGELSPSERDIKWPVLLNVPITHWMWKAFLPAGANRDHEACNAVGPNAPDYSPLSLPPMLVAIGTLDILQDYQANYAKKLQEQGKDVTVIKYNGGFHTFYGVDIGKPTAKVKADIRDFIISHAL